MRSQETVDLRDRAADQLQADLEETRQQLFNLRFQSATRQLADVSQVHKAKVRIARINTLLRVRAILEMHDAAVAPEAGTGAPAVAAEEPEVVEDADDNVAESDDSSDEEEE